MKLDIFKMPVPVSVSMRISAITNAFFNAIIPQIEPDVNEVNEALHVLGMDEDTICCAYCGDNYTEWDHLNALIKNKRPTGYITEINNLVPSCGKCNQSKGNKNWKEWMLGPAKNSPATRKILDIDTRVQRLEAYEDRFKPHIIDVEQIVGDEEWNKYIRKLDEIHNVMHDCQLLSEQMKNAIDKWFKSTDNN